MGCFVGFLIIFCFFFTVPFAVHSFWFDGSDESVFPVDGRVSDLAVSDDGFVVKLPSTEPGTVSDVLARFGFSLSENDSVFPAQDVPVASGLTIILSRAKNITVTADGEDRSFVTHAPTVLHALSDARVSFLEDDIVTPIVPTPLSDGTEIVVVRVVISEETKKRSIDFETVVVFDDELGWRERKTTQKGKEGVREIVYELHSHDGKEVSRKVLSDVVVSDPVTEKVVQGTYVKVGKSHSGLGTWYAHTGTLAAASPWLPMGSYARVTNRTNGKSVIVKINDRGPFGKNRIIDLDRVAFEKIASIGAGVIDVKVEEIEN